MRPSRGMGDIAPSKMPKGAKKARRDDTDFTQYKKGGAVKFGSGGAANTKESPAVAAARKAEESLRNYNDELMFMERSKIPPPEVQQAQKKKLYQQMIEAAPLGYKPSFKPGENYGLQTPKEWGDVEQRRKKGGPVWSKPRPKELGKPSVLTAVKKAAAKAFAKRTGTKYPSLVANMHGAKHGRKS